MAKNYGTAIGEVLLTSKVSQWRGVVSVIYKDEKTMILRDWPNTPLPKYFLVAKDFNDQTWTRGRVLMQTLCIHFDLLLLPLGVNDNFDAIAATFMTPEQVKAANEALKAEK